jgi:hypothetical protein
MERVIIPRIVPSRRTRRFGIRTSKPTRSPREMVVEAIIGVMVAVAVTTVAIKLDLELQTTIERLGKFTSSRWWMASCMLCASSAVGIPHTLLGYTVLVRPWEPAGNFQQIILMQLNDESWVKLILRLAKARLRLPILLRNLPTLLVVTLEWFQYLVQIWNRCCPTSRGTPRT